jgi:hypothetical protein
MLKRTERQKIVEFGIGRGGHRSDLLIIIRSVVGGLVLLSMVFGRTTQTSTQEAAAAARLTDLARERVDRLDRSVPALVVVATGASPAQRDERSAL